MSTSRGYQSSLREERAIETRTRIRHSARELFASGGFTETTIDQIAARAGVSSQTVYAVFGTKGRIVAAMLQDLEETAGLSDRVGEIIAEQEPHRQLRLFVSWIRTLFEQGAPLMRAGYAAMNTPEVAQLVANGDENRRRGTANLAEIWARKGALLEHIETDAAAERLWLLTSTEQYMVATDKLGWDPAQYEQWLGDLLERELLGPQQAGTSSDE